MNEYVEASDPKTLPTIKLELTEAESELLMFILQGALTAVCNLERKRPDLCNMGIARADAENVRALTEKLGGVIAEYDRAMCLIKLDEAAVN